MEALIRGFKDSDPWVQTESIASLIFITDIREEKGFELDRRRRAALLARLNDQNPYVRENAVSGFYPWREDLEVKSALERAFYDSISIVREASRRVGDQSLEVLLDGLRDEHPMIRISAIGRLNIKGYDSTTVRKQLIERLRDPYEGVVYEASKLLSRLNEKDAVNPILDLLNIGWESQVRLALGTMNLGSIEEVVKKKGWKPSPNFKLDAVVRGYGESNVGKLIQKIKHGDRLERVSAILQLTWIDTPESNEVLLKSVASQDPYIRFVSIDVLQMKIFFRFLPQYSSKIIDRLLEISADENPHVRRKMIKTLASLVHYRKKRGNGNPFIQELPDDSMEQLRDYIANFPETEEDELIKIEVDKLIKVLE